jgi:tetratricopeptide (TPR) repeat protein
VAKSFAKLLFPMLLLCIIALTALVSFSKVHGTVLLEPNSSNYFSELNVKEQQAQAAFNNSHCSDPQLMQRLAMLYWQNDKVGRAQDYLDELWDRHANGTDSIHYDPVFVQDGLNAASLYLARGVNDHAQRIYERLIEYESAHLPATDPRLGREYNNLGLTYLRSAEANDDLKNRMYWFKQSLEQSKKAEKIFRMSPKCNPQLICCLQNQVVTYSEMGDDDKALKLNKIVNAQLDAWHDHRNVPPPDTVN